MNKVLMYPFLKRTDFELDREKISEEKLKELVDYYTGQLVITLKNHGFEDNEDFITDMKFVSEFLKSAVYRNVGKYHHLQDDIDEWEAELNDVTFVSELELPVESEE